MAQITPGENVGIIAAQSLGERQTQNTLSSFHRSGLISGTSGVPRFNALLAASKTPKSVNVRFTLKKNDSINSLQDAWKHAGHDLLNVNFKSLVKSCTVDEQSAQVFIIFDPFKMIKHNITIHKLEKILSEFEIDEIFISSPIEIRFHIAEVRKFDLEQWPAIEMIHIQGIEDVHELLIYPENNDYRCIASGNKSFNELIQRTDITDVKSIISDNVWDLYDKFGIEACKNYLRNAIHNCVCSDGSYIDKCHTKLLSDLMCAKGTVLSVSRYSVRSRTSPLARASFEETLTNLLESGLKGEDDLLKSVSSSIITSRLSGSGTGAVDVIYDPNFKQIHEDLVKEFFSNSEKFLVK